MDGVPEVEFLVTADADPVAVIFLWSQLTVAGELPRYFAVDAAADEIQVRIRLRAGAVPDPNLWTARFAKCPALREVVASALDP
jgi:hypothetical protein